MTYLSQLNNYDNYTTKDKMIVHLFQLTSLRENDIFENQKKQKSKTFIYKIKPEWFHKCKTKTKPKMEAQLQLTRALLLPL